MSKEPTLEIADNEVNKTEYIGVGGAVVAMSPLVDEEYWLFRVKLTEKQAVVGFPKFSTIGIGFAQEEDDWNTNLPYTCETDEIFRHIKKNKGDDEIDDADVIKAIEMVQAAARTRFGQRVTEEPKGADDRRLIPLEDAAAGFGIDLSQLGDEDTKESTSDMPKAWSDLFKALTLLAREQNNDISPFRCGHDQLFVSSDPGKFTEQELAQLDEWGFYPEDEEDEGMGFYSFRYGSA